MWTSTRQAMLKVEPGILIWVKHGSGDTFKGSPLGPYGLFKVLEIVDRRDGRYLNLARYEGGRSGGTYLLRVTGGTRRSKGISSILTKPYKFRKPTRKERDRASEESDP